METKKTYWHKIKKGTRYITMTEDSIRPEVFGDLAQLIYSHCKIQIRDKKDRFARKIIVTITG